MRILVTADTHCGHTSPKSLSKYAQWVTKENPDIVVIAGDVAEMIKIMDGNQPISTLDWFKRCLEVFRDKIDVPILVVPGNHDLWVSQNSTWSSLDLWNHILREITQESGCHWLEGSNWIQNSVAIVGSYLHYDYSAQDKTGPVAGMPHLYFRKNKHKVNNDGLFMAGLPDDLTFAREIGAAFQQRLLSAEEDSSVSHILIATHVPCLEQQISRHPMKIKWALGTPYMGNLSHEPLIRRCKKVRWVISGHNHVGSKSEIERPPLLPIQVRTTSASYRKPAHRIAIIDSL